MKGWLAPFLAFALLGYPSAGLAEFDECRFMDQVLNRLGKAMAINRAIIAGSNDPAAVAAASEALSEQNKQYRNTKRQRSKAGCDGWERD